MNRAACFVSEGDYRSYLTLLEDLSRRHACSIHAYVLMTNHVHLLLTPEKVDGPSWLMKDLGQRYVQLFNRKHHRTGTLWEGRFRSSIIDSEGYLLRCQRYIEANPVRAGMVSRPGEYRWSSFRANANGVPSPVLTPHDLYLRLAEDDTERRTVYRTLFDDELSNWELKMIREATNGGFAIGRKPFLDEVERRLDKRAERRAHGRPRKQAAE